MRYRRCGPPRAAARSMDLSLWVKCTVRANGRRTERVVKTRRSMRKKRRQRTFDEYFGGLHAAPRASSVIIAGAMKLGLLLVV